MTESKEKRAHARIAAPLSARIVVGARETELAVRDVSISGIFLYTRDPPGPVGTLVSLKLAVTAGIKPIPVQGKIVRIVLDPEGKAGTILGIGVHFETGSPGQAQSVLELLDRAMLGKGTHNRAFPRICYQLEVTCRTKDEVKALLRDIGEGGVGLTVARAFSKDENIMVEIAAAKGAALRLAGWVVSCESVASKTGSFRIGVRFGRLPPQTRKDLKLFLEALYRR